MIADWSYALRQAIRDTEMTVVGYDDVPNEAQARVGITLMNVYSHPSAFLYFEAASYDQIDNPGDIIFCHPDVGILFIEVKAYSIDFIQRIEANNLIIKYADQPLEKAVNPARQAKELLFTVKSRVKVELKQRNIITQPLFNWLVAFPNIRASEWLDYGYDECLPEQYILFHEHIAHPHRLGQRIERYTKHVMQRLRLPVAMRPEHLDAIKAATGNSDAIHRARPPRRHVANDKLGGRIDELLKIDTYLSEEQKALSRMLVRGHPRLIRGVAGSGKSLVLGNLVGHYLKRVGFERKQQHMFDEQKPLRVAVVCFNRSLVGMLRQRIEKAYTTIMHEALPDDDTLYIGHFNGLLMRHAWRKNDGHDPDKAMPYIPIVDEMKDATTRAKKYREQLDASPLPVLYDAIFVDEGQDFEPEEFGLLLDMLQPDPKSGEKNLIIFYDDAQNLYGRQRPNWQEIGLILTGSRARVMKECYRNTREVLELGFNILLGVQAPADKRVQTRGYTDISYLTQHDLVDDLGDHIRVKFTTRNFRKPHIAQFDDREAEQYFVLQEVKRLITEEFVRPEEILLLYPTRKEFPTLIDAADLVLGAHIKNIHNPVTSEEKDAPLFALGQLTIATVYSAKGYDAQVVFVLGADYYDLDAQGRALFYVASTRAKEILYVTGTPKPQWTLLKEAMLVNEMI